MRSPGRPWGVALCGRRRGQARRCVAVERPVRRPCGGPVPPL